MPLPQDSIAPGARTLTRIWRHPLTRWAAGIISGALVASFTTGLYPLFRGWAVTRTSVSEIDEACDRPQDEGCPEAIRTMQRAHTFDAERYRAENDFSKLNHAERITWLYDHHTLERRRLVEAYRQAAGLEAELRMIAPAARSEAARKKGREVEAFYDDLILKGREAEEARRQALQAAGFSP